jgi:hypothetical protein
LLLEECSLARSLARSFGLFRFLLFCRRTWGSLIACEKVWENTREHLDRSSEQSAARSKQVGAEEAERSKNGTGINWFGEDVRKLVCTAGRKRRRSSGKKGDGRSKAREFLDGFHSQGSETYVFGYRRRHALGRHCVAGCHLGGPTFWVDEGSVVSSPERGTKVRSRHDDEMTFFFTEPTLRTGPRSSFFVFRIRLGSYAC